MATRDTSDHLAHDPSRGQRRAEPAPDRRLAVVTGASRGLGRALATRLATAGWDLLLDARTEADLVATADHLEATGTVRLLVGDVTDPHHRAELAAAAGELGPVDLLVNNAGGLGPSPLPRLVDLDPDDLQALLAANTVAPLAVFQALADHLADEATVVNVTSDAGVEAWEGWGGYGLTKAALDHVSAVLAVEHPALHVHAVDPGDLRTDMHQAAFPGEDISDRPLPETVVDTLLALVEAALPSGRHRLADLADRADLAEADRTAGEPAEDAPAEDAPAEGDSTDGEPTDGDTDREAAA